MHLLTQRAIFLNLLFDFNFERVNYDYNYDLVIVLQVYRNESMPITYVIFYHHKQQDNTQRNRN